MSERPPSHVVGMTRQQRIAFVARWATGLWRCDPDFIVIGGMKCGTSALYRYLESHPCFLPPLRKEVHYFDYPNRYRWGKLWYRAHFPLSKDRKDQEKRLGAAVLTGEASPYYGYHPLAMPRIAKALPGVKLVALVRNPVDRAYSHYHHEHRLGYETSSFEEAIALEEERTVGEADRIRKDPSYYSYSHQHWSYLARGHYLDQIEHWTRWIDRDQLYILIQEELRADPVRALAGVAKFLGFPAWRPQELEPAPSAYPPLPPKLRKRFAQAFSFSNDRLAKYLGRDLGWD